MKRKLKEISLITLGSLMVAVGIHFFLLPSKFTLGGATGMALILSKFIPLSVGALLMLINIGLFILGFIVIGNKFGVKTVCTALGLSAVVWLFELFIPIDTPLVDDKFLQLIIAVLLYGGGIGIVLNSYASTGGSDIPAMIMQKYLGLDLGKSCLIVDFIVTVFVGINFGTEVAFYSLVGVIINGVIIDATINGLNTSKSCIINTQNPESISDFIVSLGRSANVYKAMGAYTKQERFVIQTVMSRRDFVKLKKYLSENEPNAFMVVTPATSVFGWQWKHISE